MAAVVSKRLGSPYVSGRSRHWLKFKNPAAPAVKRGAEEGATAGADDDGLCTTTGAGLSPAIVSTQVIK